MLLGVLREPEEGWPLEDVQAVLAQGVALGRIVPLDKFVPPPEEDIIDSWM